MAVSRILLYVLLTAVLLPGFVADACAHAAFVRSDPADGSVLGRAPAHLHLVFSEPVSPLVLSLIRPSGDALTLDRYELHSDTLVVDVPAGLPEGSYAMSWRVTSADGHPVAGSFAFSIGKASGPVTVKEVASNGLRLFIWLFRTAFYVGLFLGVGALAFHAFIAPAPPPARRLSLVAIATGLASAVPLAASQGLDLTGAGFDRLLDPAVWAAASASVYLHTLALGVAAMGLGLATWFVSSRRWVGFLTVAALAGVGAALAASGHASTATPQWLTIPAVFVHAASVAVWAGSLLPFALVLRSGGPSARRMLDLFSAAILPFIACLAVTGVALAVVQVGQPSALWTTAYGRVLLAKLGLLVLLFTLAAINRFSLTPAFRQRKPRAGPQFARSVRMEIVLVCLILGVVSVWRFTPPPRSLAVAAQADPAVVHIHAGQAMAEISIAPGQAGPVTISIHVMSGGSAAPEPREVSMALSNPGAGVEPLRRQAERIGPERWQIRDLLLTPSGEWSIKVELLVSDFEKQVLEGKIRLK